MMVAEFCSRGAPDAAEDSEVDPVVGLGMVSLPFPLFDVWSRDTYLPKPLQSLRFEPIHRDSRWPTRDPMTTIEKAGF